ncbi:hypothetical protein OEZ86_003346 [Tetradesmus obliquus]|nr:hypothetical protein OEZ86_003346 [Tetradesmus obliquus]
MNDLMVKFFVAGLLGGALVAAQVTPALTLDPGCSPTEPNNCGTPSAPICVDLGSNEDYCGNCTTKCSGSQVCVQGECVCSKNWPNSCTYSNSTGSITVCHNFTRSEVACGRCLNTCSSKTECILGECKCSSPTATRCDDNTTTPISTYCVKNITTSDEHCGVCFNTCPTGQSCRNSACTCPSNKPKQCPWGATSICVNTNTSENHCGDCWKRCNYDEKCVAGVCTNSCLGDATELCPVPGLTGVTLCANTKKDAFHCGKCFNVCPRSQICKDGSCQCSRGKTACPVGSPSSIRCVDIRTSDVACGGCGKVCPSNLDCRDSQCKCPRDRPNECPTTTGQVLCFNFKSDKSACGGCFNQCAASQKCRDGKCVN